MGIKTNGIKSKIQENLATSIMKTLQRDGYIVKSNLKCPGNFYRGAKAGYGKYILDIFAYRGSNDIIVVEFENCTSLLSRENENKWKYLVSKPGIDLHIVVPYSCREKAYFKSKIKNIPVEIHDYTNWKDTFDFKINKCSK